MHRERSEKEIVFENVPLKTTADVTHLWASELGRAKTLCLESEMFLQAKAEAKTRVARRPRVVAFQSPQPRRASQGEGTWSVSDSPQLPKVRRALSLNAAMTTKLLFSSFHVAPEVTPAETESAPEETGADPVGWDFTWLPCCAMRYDPTSKKQY